MISIDGSYLEGGGQIIRTALALSTISGQSFEIDKIRAGRVKPGLKAQHVNCVKALEQILKVNTKGVELGSSYVSFEPKKIIKNKINTDIETAGSITLLLQAVLLPCFFISKKTTISIKGGTNVAWSMPIEYFKYVMMPQLRKFCESIDIKTLKKGYYPKGGGEVKLKIKNKYILKEYSNLSAFLKEIQKEHKIQLLEKGKLQIIEGISHASKNLQNREVAERQAKIAKNKLSMFNIPIKIDCEYSDTLSTGNGLTLWGKYSGKDEEFNPVIIGADALGEPKKSAEEIGIEAATKLIDEINKGAIADEHLTDNLIPWMGLFKPGGIKTSKITNHSLTNIFTVEKFLGKSFELKENTIFSK